ncbi:MAG: hypothetical protein ACXABY_26020 [Candidatus Thorarchaeota archaeon]|jgi:hypothetical protein
MTEQSLAEVVARIDERAGAILVSQERLEKSIQAHEDRDRIDFKEVNNRITALEKRQNWMIGVGTTVATGIGMAAAGFVSIMNYFNP